MESLLFSSLRTSTPRSICMEYHRTLYSLIDSQSIPLPVHIIMHVVRSTIAGANWHSNKHLKIRHAARFRVFRFQRLWRSAKGISADNFLLVCMVPDSGLWTLSYLDQG